MSVKNNYLIINTQKQIEEIKPEFKNFNILVIEKNLDFQNINEKKIFFIDDFLSSSAIKNIQNKSHLMNKEWFLNNNKEDISILNGLSFGKLFCSTSISIFVTSYKYKKVFDYLLNKGSSFYYYSNSPLSIFNYIKSLKNHKNKFHLLDHVIPKKKNEFNIRSAAFENTFVKRKSKKGFIGSLINFINHNKFLTSKKKILFYHVHAPNLFYEISKSKDYRCFTPPNKNFLGKSSFYFIHSDIKKKNYLFKNRIINNLKSKKIDRFLIYQFEDRIINNIDQLIGFYENCNKILKKMKPSLIVLGSETLETCKIIVFLANKLNILSVLLHHGIHIYHELDLGKNFEFSYYFAHGKMHSFTLSDHIEKKKILISGSPAFDKFPLIKSLSINSKIKKKNNNLKRCLVLYPDYCEFNAADSLRFYYNYIEKVVYILEKKGIKVVGFKSRSSMNKEYEFIGQRKIKIYDGKYNFFELSNLFDMSVGPLSSAFFEISSLKKDYFIFTNLFKQNLDCVTDKIKNYVYLSSNYENLKKNIDLNRVFKKNTKLHDMIFYDYQKSKSNFSFIAQLLKKCLEI